MTPLKPGCHQRKECPTRLGAQMSGDREQGKKGEMGEGLGGCWAPDRGTGHNSNGEPKKGNGEIVSSTRPFDKK